MALTKEDLRQINELFINGINTLIIPSLQKLLEWRDEIDEWRDEIDGWRDEIDEWRVEVDGWRKDTDKGFVSLNESIKDNTLMVGDYFQKCSTKDEYRILSKRVKYLELSRS